MKTKKISPIKDKQLLRSPGYSLRMQLLNKGTLPIFLMTIPIFLLAGMYFGTLPIFHSQYASAVIFILVVSYTIFLVFFVRRLDKKMNKIMMGRDGELFVSQVLEETREPDWNILHDFEFEYAKGKKANIDHIIISPQGIFIIETKTLSKTEGQKEELIFDGQSLKFKSNQKELPLPVDQVESSSKYLKEFIFQRLGIKTTIVPIVVYPGWCVRGPYYKKTDELKIWACNPSYIQGRVKASPYFLQANEIERIYQELKVNNYVD